MLDTPNKACANHADEWADQARNALLQSLASPRPQIAISRRALQLKRANALWREAKAREADMQLYARMAAGDEISESEAAEHADRIERGYGPSERWLDHEWRRKERSLRPNRELRIRRKMCGAGRVAPSIREHYTATECGVMAVIADDVMKQGSCTRTASQLASAVKCKTRTVRRALATAKALGHVDVQERKAPCGKLNLSNIVRIVSMSWIKWIGRAFAWRPKVRPSQHLGVTTRSDTRELQEATPPAQYPETIHGGQNRGPNDRRAPAREGSGEPQSGSKALNAASPLRGSASIEEAKASAAPTKAWQ